MSLPASLPAKAEAAAELLRRRKARSSLLDFIRYMNPDYIVSAFSMAVCDELDQFIRDVVAKKRPILVLQAPPQHGKSEIVSRYLPAYVFGLLPDIKVAGLSYAKDLATDMNRDVQRIMLSSEYRALFPKSALGGDASSSVEARRNTEVFEIPGHGGAYISQGVGGPLTGKKVNIGIIDDPIKNAQEALSGTVKNGIWNWYVTTYLTRLSKDSGQIIMATSWAADDLSARIAQKYDRAKVLKFPAIDEAGKALIPELHPIDKLLETKEVIGDYFWSAMYQQSPKPIGGAIFKDSGVRYYLPKDLPDRFDRVILSWDMTFKDGEGTDFVVGQVWGRAGANSYLLDQVRARMGFTATKDSLVKMAEKWPNAREKLVEDKANGPAVIDSLRATVPGLIAVNPDGSKVARAHACTAEWEAGNVLLPHPDIAPWVADFVAEVTTFPAAAHDDQVDAMTQALRALYGGAKKRAGVF